MVLQRLYSIAAWLRGFRRFIPWVSFYFQRVWWEAGSGHVLHQIDARNTPREIDFFFVYSSYFYYYSFPIRPSLLYLLVSLWGQFTWD
jgi:hypothetical protein